MYDKTLKSLDDMMDKAAGSVKDLIDNANFNLADAAYELFLKISLEHESVSIKKANLKEKHE